MIEVDVSIDLFCPLALIEACSGTQREPRNERGQDEVGLPQRYVVSSVISHAEGKALEEEKTE